MSPAPVRAADGADGWSTRRGGSEADFAYSIASDGIGNTVIAGRTASAPIDLGGGALAGSGDTDIIFAMYSANGSHAWSKRYGGTGNDGARSVAVDAAGSIVIAGYTWSDSIDLGGGPLIGPGSLVVAKHSPDGDHLWSRRFRGTYYSDTISVATDASGNILLAASAAGAPVELGGVGSEGDESWDIVVAMLTPEGSHIWSKRIGGGDDELGSAVSVGTSGELVVGGSTYSGSIDLGGGPLTGPDRDAIVAVFSSSGDHLWSKRLGGDQEEDVSSVCADASGNVLVTGYTRSSSIDLGGGALEGYGYPYASLFLAKYSSTGEHVWSKRPPGLDHEGRSVATTPDGDVLLLASDAGYIDLGGGPLASEYPPDVVVARYSAAGEHRWSKRFGGMATEIGYWIASDPWGGVLVAGTVRGSSMDLGQGPLPEPVQFSGWDLFAGRLNSDLTPPFSTLDATLVTTAPPVSPGILGGVVLDDRSGVATVTVSFASRATGAVTRVTADLACDEDRRSCKFYARVPSVLPGAYSVTAQAFDRARNLEQPRSSMTVIVL